MTELNLPQKSRWLDQRVLTLGVVLALLLTSAAYGYVLTRDLPEILLVGVPVALLVVLLGLQQTEILAVALLGITWGHISDILIKYHGIPSPAKGLVAILVVLVLYQRFVERRRPLATHPLLWWMVGYLLVVAAGLWYAPRPDRTWVVLVDFAKEVLLLFLVINTLTSARWLERAAWCMLLIGALLGTLTFYQEVTWSYSNMFGGLARSTTAAIADGVSNRPRAGGTTGEPNAFGQQMLVLVPIGLWAALYARTLPARILGGYAALACLAGAALSFSRGTFVALIVMGVLLLLRLRLDIRYTLAILLVAVAAGSASPEVRARFNTLSTLLPGGERVSGERDASLERREIEMLMAVYMFADHPIIGVGADNYVPLFPKYIRAHGSNVEDTKRNAHSLYLEVAAEHGVIGLFTIGGIMVLSYTWLRRASRWFSALGDKRMAELAAALAIGFVGYAVSATFLHADYSRFLWLQVDLAAACGLLASRAYAAVYPAPAAQPAPPSAAHPTNRPATAGEH